MTLKYTSVAGFWKFLGLYKHSMDFNPTETPVIETVASTTVAAGDYYLDQMGVDTDSLVIKRSVDSRVLTSTAYTFDADRSKITISAAGATDLSTSSLWAEYGYCSLGRDLNYTETENMLARSEEDVEEETNTIFADQTATNPGYKKITNEFDAGKGVSISMYYTRKYPVVKLQTTTSGAFTLGATAITFADATGFPTTGTIYIGGNKVTYTNKSSNTLTVPSTTPTIADGSVVRGEVIEVSLDPAGVTPSFTVLTPDVEYNMNYDTGEIQLLDDYYVANLYGLIRPADGVNDRMKLSYMNAYHDTGAGCSIPVTIVQSVYLKVASKLVDAGILKSNVNVSDNFSPSAIREVNDRINKDLQRYKIINVNNV